MDEREKAREIAFGMMLTIVNEWHRQVGIDDVMKTKLTRKIADTVATGVIEKTLDSALRQARRDALMEAAGIARDFSWNLPLEDDRMLNEFSDDIACEIQQQIAAAIEQAAKD